ncbi:MAG TPA: mannose-6-phosphate isomerase, class I [Nocardioidaceae bacterium]|nr:mannose-6-phosphate isomerase, class I [Nocardioidaceae bacterium]
MHRLAAPVRDYAWGSTTHIPKFCGLPVDDSPAAEMWFGAHPSAPSLVDFGTGLDALIAESPVRCLGLPVVDSFGPRLPFLMKLLAAAEPLSLQVHPTGDRARIRFEEQNAAGIPLDATERSYPDASHKPELVYALTRFEGMAGFRDLAKSARILRGFHLGWLDAIADHLDESETPYQTLREEVATMLSATGPPLRRRLAQLQSAAREAEARSHRPHTRLRPPDVEASAVERESVRVFAQTAQLVERYPEDPGVLVTLLLNHVVLAVGEAMFIDAGVVHAYTSGFGLEVMASSDNVVRAGLTPKYVDVGEMLEITSFTPIPPPRWKGAPLRQSHGALLAPPVDEFELVVADVRAGQAYTEPARPAILLCLEGELVVATDSDKEPLARGEAVFLEAAEGASSTTGRGRLAVARAPQRS